MADVISPDELAAEISKTLEVYSKVTMDKLIKAVDQVAKETVADLKRTSPVDSGQYAKSWTSSKDSQYKSSDAYGRVVHVKSRFASRTLQLEYGHDIIRDGVREGRAEARPHIAPASEKAVQEFERDLIKSIEEIGL